MLTKMITSGTIGIFGDALCQSMEIGYFKSGKKFDIQRTATFGLVGTVYVAPMLHVHYSYILPYFVPKAGSVAAIKKLAID